MKNSNKYPSGFEGEEIAMLHMNATHERYMKRQNIYNVLNFILYLFVTYVVLHIAITGLNNGHMIAISPAILFNIFVIYRLINKTLK